MDATGAALLAAAAFVAGAINSVAGGGTIVSFPAAVAAGLSSVVANASNAVALTPSALASAWAYRRELRAGMPELRVLIVPSVFGGIVGAGLLLVTPEKVFDASVPLLLLLATAMLVFQNLRRKPAPPAALLETLRDAEERSAARALTPDQVGLADHVPMLASTAGRARAAAAMFAVAIYGGYFGAGMGIMTLAMLGWLGARDMHRMNVMKTIIGVAVNGTAAIARKVDQSKVRWLVVAIGATLTALLAYQRYG